MLIILAILIAVIVSGVYYFPVYLPFLLSFLFRAPDRRAMKLALRVSPLFSMLILAVRPRPARPDFGDDVAGNIRGAEYHLAHEFWPDVAWTWGAGLSCLFLALVVGFFLSRQQSHRYSVNESA